MKWENPIEDPMPHIILEAHGKGARENKHPCSICRSTSSIPGQQRNHFHASDLGACKKRTLYTMRNPQMNASSTSAEFLKDGHLHESSMLTNIHNGFQNMDKIKEMFGKPIVFPAANEEEVIAKIPVMVDGEIEEITLIAHYDGILIFDSNGIINNKFLLECKSVKKYKFDLVAKGEMDKEWYGQMQTYMRVLNIKVAYLLVKHRETSQMHMPIRIDYNEEYLNERRDVLVEIYTAFIKGGDIDREHTKRNNAECKFCKFADQCWGNTIDYPTQKTIEQLISVEENKGESIYD